MKTDARTPDLVIFDCDGVLVDSELLANRANVRALAARGVHIDLSEFMGRYVGVSVRDMLADLRASYGFDAPEGWIESVNAELDADFEQELRAIEGAGDVLEHLRGAGVPVCVASSSSPAKLRRTLGLTGLWPLVEPHVFSSSMVERGKPFPDLFLFAARQMGAAPQGCVVIEDSVAGVRAGVAAGMRVLGFAGGGHCGPGHADQLSREGAVAVAGRMRELLPYLTDAGADGAT